MSGKGDDLMDIDANRIQQLVERPSESLSVELKRWINPDTPEGIAKIVRAALALRNHNGGYLVIGFNNDTLEPDIGNEPQDVKALFNLDKIQGLVSRFASEPFEVAIEFPERDRQLYPVIVIPPGVKTPVAAKSDLRSSDDKSLISPDDVYFRSLRSNNTPSTTRATWKDWPSIVEICFDNREADIGRFLRRHLSGLTPEVAREFASTVAKSAEPEVTTEDSLRRYLQESGARYATVVKERDVKLPEHGTWEVGLLLNGSIPKHTANSDFLNLLDSSNPRYTGWPIWLDSRGFRDVDTRPFVFEGTWEALIISSGSGWRNHLDFMRLDPKGRFYLRRALEDDFSGIPGAPKAMTVFDFGLPVIRTAEAIAVGIAFGKAMGFKPEETYLDFGFRWDKLRGRELVSWANPGRDISPRSPAYQDEVISFVTVPLETPLSALSEFVSQAVQPLFEIFDGFTLNKNAIEDLTRRLVERRL